MAATGPNCLPQLHAMMRWYAADSLHDFRFVKYSINTKKAQGYYLLNQAEVDRYLAVLRRSGYFSEQYLAAEKASYQALQRDFVRTKQTDGEPQGLEADRIFPVTSFVDMMELRDRFVFSVDEARHTVRFDTGEAVQLITFTKACQIDQVSWVSRSPQID